MSSTTLKLKPCLQPIYSRVYSTLPEMPKCDFTPRKYQGLSLDKLKQIRSQNVNPALTTYYPKPIALHQGYKQWLFDIDGKRYLDMFGGICTVSVGHCHPKVEAATIEQMRQLGHVSNIYMHPKIHEYAEKLTSKFPGDLKVVYFVNSGSEANDLAILLARSYTGNNDIISFRNAYHGMSYQTMGITAHNTWKHNVLSSSGIQHAMNPDVFRGIWGGKNCRDSPVQTKRSCECSQGECKASKKYVEQLEEVLQYSIPKGKVAGLFAESIQGVGGTVQFPKGYLKKATELIRENGGLVISDEVQTGFGRTGDHFWGFEGHGIIPDIVTMAKGIGNGYPLGAVVTTPEIAKTLTKALFFNTYGGNPVASAVGMAVLDVIDEEKLQDNSKNVGTYLLKELEKLQGDFGVIGDVRGKGLMIGVEFVENSSSTKPLAPEKFLDMWNFTKEAGVLLGKGGYYNQVLRIKPPMSITKEDADFTVGVLRKALEFVYEKYKI